MATPQENIARFQEISNRGLQNNLDPDKRARFDEALRRGLINPPVQVDVPDNIPGVSDAGAAPQEQGFGDALIGAANLANIGITKLGEQAVSGIGGALQALNPLAGEGAGARRSEQIQEAIPDVALTTQGQQLIQTISDKFKTSPEIVQNIVSEFSNLGQSLGERTFEATGSPLAATLVGALPEALEAGTGVVAGRAAKAAATNVQVPKVFTNQSPVKQAIANKLAAGSTDIDGARFKLIDDEIIPDASVPGGQRVVKAPPKVARDKSAIESIKQGFDEGVIADVKQASPADKKAMLKMVDIAGRVKSNKKFGLRFRPSDVAGDTLMNRLDVVRKSNRDAGKALGRSVERIKNKAVESAHIGDAFAEDLSGMGIALNRNNKGGIDVDFSGSSIKGLAGPEAVIKRVVERMASTTPPTAGELHNLKKFIDEHVTFGKNAEGLAGEAERVLKRLRVNVNETLGNQFDDYAAANFQYSKTIDALDAFQDVAGKKMDLTGPNADAATGTLMRRLMGNAQSRVRLLDSIDQIESVVSEFGGKLTGQKLLSGEVKAGLKNDLFTQVLFADELDAVFGPAARTSLQGQFDQALKQGATAAASPTGLFQAGVDVAGKGVEKLRGINEREAFKSIKQLLREK